MNKQEIYYKLSHYLAFDLPIAIGDDYDEDSRLDKRGIMVNALGRWSDGTCDAYSYDYGIMEIVNQDENNTCQRLNMIRRRVKPILRPMSDLTSPLENGEVPLVKIADLHGLKVEKYEEDGIISYGWNTYVCDDWQGYELGFNSDKRCLGIYYDEFDFNNPSNNIVENLDISLGGIEYLIKNHFDLFGLIEEGIAVNINILRK